VAALFVRELGARSIATMSMGQLHIQYHPYTKAAGKASLKSCDDLRGKVSNKNLRTPTSLYMSGSS